MSKKKFTDGINDIFSSAEASEQTVTGADDTLVVAGQSARRQSSHKTFVTNLDSLLAEITEEPFFSEPASEEPRKLGKSKGGSDSGYRAPVTGLDALIRQTLVSVEGEDEVTTKRRISVIVDKMNLERLKSIARMEGTFMKDIIADLIESYVLKYTKEKGIEL